MATPNAEYWARRMKMLEDALLEQGFDYAQNLETQFDRATAQIEKDLAAWYQRFASNNSITYAEAQKWLTANELKEFHWTVEDYIKYAQDNELSGAWVKQLENASARVHISRLDAIKLELQQQAERLAGGQLDGLDALTRRIYTEGYYKTAFELQRGLGTGWTLHALNEDTISRVLSRPWTTDGLTFTDRVWTNKDALVNSVNQHLTQMIIRGEGPRNTIDAIAHDMGVSKAKAGRLVMTESAYFSSSAQKDCFNGLGVERYTVVASLDGDTCELCSDMDGKVFKMSDYAEGLTAPPFHPWCRCCTAPYYEDMAELGERAARDADGKSITVPRSTTYAEWKQKYIVNPAEMQYNIFKKSVQAQIGTKYPLTLNIGQQNKHIIGSTNFDPRRSTLTADPEELIKLYAGKGEPIRTNAGAWNQRERFTHTSEIGIWRNNLTGEEAPTNKGIIHYTKHKGAHIVPANPIERGGKK